MLATTVAHGTAAPSQRVESTRVIAAARAMLDTRLGEDAARADVAVIGTPEDIALPQGAVTLQARAPMGRWPRARVGIPVDVGIGGHVVRSATVWFAVGIHRSVLSYADDAAPGTLAGTLKFSQQDTDIAALREMPVSDPAQLDGRRLRHPVLAGTPVQAADFEQVPAVDRQSRVEVDVSLGAIHMRTQGTSSSMGNVGDLVTVLVDGAEAPVRARVTDKGVVDVVQ
ncbi:flagellar basal body P-ring formation chaperone FlgA [Dyella sp.]|uniref:flagellar basal body P-ring formation chaperone FlgA n=1 Tax=Dyella sp. TaxID=1869338 RepID=UPI002ED23F47